MVKHNNVVPNAHFNKKWKTRVRVNLNQPARKKRRRLARRAKAQKISPAPTDGLLRPEVHCPTLKYNLRVRAGRGFTIEELKAAKINPKEARNIGIAVDYRRKNKSTESLQANVARLNAYTARLVVFPRGSGAKASKKAGVSSKQDRDNASQLTGAILPISQAANDVEFVEITDEMKQFGAYSTLRTELNKSKNIGQKLKRKILAEEEAKKKVSKKKKR
eukprot:g4808.t1